MKMVLSVALSGLSLAGLAAYAALGPVHADAASDQSSDLPLALRMAQHAGSTVGMRTAPAAADQVLTHRNATPIAVCLAPGTIITDELQDRLDSIYGNSIFGDRYQLGGRWTGSSFGNVGDPITLTWSLAPDGLSIPGGIGEPTSNNSLFATWDAKLPRATWIALIDSSLNRWSQISGLSYVRVKNGANDWDTGAAWGTGGNGTTLGDVRIAMHPIDGFNGVLAYNEFPNSGDMVLDRNDASGNSNLFSSTNNYRFFRNVIQHEHGHGIGLFHVCPSNETKLMEPFISTEYDGIRHDDIRAAHANYGDINEPDNTVTFAVSAGNVSVGTNITLGTVPGTAITDGATLSIDANGETDFHKFTTSQILLANVTLSPVGLTYLQGPQTSGCNTGTNTNSLSAADLAFDYRDPSLQLVHTQSTAAAGLAEPFSNLLLSPPGEQILRIYETGTQTQVQLYQINIVGVSVPSVTASDNVQGQVNLSWTNIPGTTQYQVLRNTVNSEAGATQIGTSATNAFTDNFPPDNTSLFYFVRSNQGSAQRFRLVGSDSGFSTAPPCPSDLNSDGFVDDADFAIFAEAYEAFVVPPANAAADLNSDGFVDDADFVIFAEAYEAFVCP